MQFKNFWKKFTETEEETKDIGNPLTLSIDDVYKQNNPWAICTAQVGRDSDKYESCVMDVKAKLGVHKDATEEEWEKSLLGTGKAQVSKTSDEMLEVKDNISVASDNKSIFYREVIEMFGNMGKGWEVAARRHLRERGLSSGNIDEIINGLCDSTGQLNKSLYFKNNWNVKKSKLSDGMKQRLFDQALRMVDDDDRNWQGKVGRFLVQNGADNDDIQDILEALADKFTDLGR